MVDDDDRIRNLLKDYLNDNEFTWYLQQMLKMLKPS